MQAELAVAQLRVGGLVPLTTTDFPGHLSAVIFCQGCPWQCRYCHNPHLIPIASELRTLLWEDVLSFLKKRRGLLSAVVFSGGEPTMQPALLPAIKAVRDLGFQVALHSAGQYPRRLREVLPYVDWIGMDIKAPPSGYQAITKRKVSSATVLESIEAVLSAKKAYEFRTTFHPLLLSDRDLQQITAMLTDAGVSRYVLQIFRKAGCNDDELLEKTSSMVPSNDTIEMLRNSFEHFELRNI